MDQNTQIQQIQALLTNPNHLQTRNNQDIGASTPASDIHSARSSSIIHKNQKLKSIKLFYLDLKNKDCISDSPIVNLSHQLVFHKINLFIESAYNVSNL